MWNDKDLSLIGFLLYYILLYNIPSERNHWIWTDAYVYTDWPQILLIIFYCSYFESINTKENGALNPTTFVISYYYAFYMAWWSDLIIEKLSFPEVY